MQDDITPHLFIPLPHPDNDLRDDVFRLRDSLSGIDSAIHSLQLVLSANDVNLDTLQEVITVLKAAQGEIGDVTSLLATKASLAYVDDKVSELNTSIEGIGASTATALTLKADQTQVDAQEQALADLEVKMRRRINSYIY